MSRAEPTHSHAREMGWLVRAIFSKQLRLLVRYPANFLAGFLTMYVFFLLIFFGGRAIAAEAIATNIEGLIVGFFLWTMAWSAFADLTWNVTREAQWGTLEQLYMSVFGFERLMLLKSAVNVLFSFLHGAIILALMMVTTGELLAVDLLTVVPVVVLGLASVVGVGLVLGGLAVIYKRLENGFQLLSFGLVGLIAAPVETFAPLKLLPLAQGSYLLRRAMSDGVRLWQFEPVEIGLLVGTALVYLALGLVFFRWAQGKARRLGVLGHY